MGREMVPRILTFLFVLVVLTLSGCAQSLYYWGDYEDALYSHYETPGQMQEFSQNLHSIITEAKENERPVPPGVYAEYGYVLMQTGHPDTAIKYYELEEQHWAVSAKLMNRMIRMARRARADSGSDAGDASQ